MAMLEAFLHDPLLNWRLMADEAEREQKSTADTRSSSGLTVEAAPRMDRNVDSVIMERGIAARGGATELDERVLNARAMVVLRRVQSKLEGTDAPPETPPMAFPGAWEEGDDEDEEVFREEDGGAGLANTPGVVMQVDRLIMEAQSHSNLCQLYWGWNPFW